MATLVPTTYSSSLSGTIGTIGADDVVIIQNSQVAYTSGLNISGVELDSFIIAPTTTSSFGSATDGGVLINLSGATYTGLLVHAGGGTAYIDPTTTIKTTKKIGAGDLYGLAGTWTAVDHAVGYSTFNETADVITLRVTGGAVDVKEHATEVLDNLTVLADGSVTCRRALGTVISFGNIIVPQRTVVAASLTIYGGTVTWWGGTITALHGWAGTLDCSGATADVTLTNSSIYSKKFTIIPPSPPWQVVYTNPTVFFGDAASV